MPHPGYKQPTKQVPCEFCGMPITVNYRVRTPKHHADCGVTRVVDAVRQMHAKKGPYYERWLEAMKDALLREYQSTPGE